MGAIQSKKQQKEISEFIQWQQLCKNLDRYALGRIFSDGVLNEKRCKCVALS